MVARRVLSAIFSITYGLAILAVGLGGLELVSRWLYPLSPGTRYLGQSGQSVQVFEGDDRFRSGIVFRQVSADFDAIATIGPNGYRVPASSQAPQSIFLGDSFTFGNGLEDDETFAAIYCARTKRRCVNLSVPGTGTHRQMRILERQFDENGWNEVEDLKLFVLAMSSSLMAGNDFADTLIEAGLAKENEDAKPSVESAQPTVAKERRLLHRIVQNRQWILAHSNLARVFYAQFGPALRAWLSLETSVAQLDAGVDAMAQELIHLADLSEIQGFRVTIYVLHPMQDLLRGTWNETTDAVRRAAGALKVIDTAPALIDNPAAFYYPYDGHLNPAGALRIADFLLDGVNTHGKAVDPAKVIPR